MFLANNKTRNCNEQTDWNETYSTLSGKPFVPSYHLSTGTLVVTTAASPNFDWLPKATHSQERVH